VKFLYPCHRTYCGRGRQCVLMAESGRAECVCQEKCRPSFVPVCGSDGRFYENHCEVYRTACLERRRIYVVHSKDCFFKGSACTMSEYNKLKSTLLEMQPKALGSGERSQQRDMEEKRALVDAMFKYLDGNEDGRLISDELEKVKSHLFHQHFSMRLRSAEFYGHRSNILMFSSLNHLCCHVSPPLYWKKSSITKLLLQWRVKLGWLSVGNMFYVFSDEGITVLQPSECEIRRHLKRTERIVATYEEMCPKGEGVSPQRCVWSSAVNVREKYVYVTQPLQSRLLVVDIQAQKVVQAVATDPFPVKMLYDKSHDQVWIITWGDMDKTHPTLQVIPQASVGEVHHAIRTTFQRVTDFFIPPTNLIITHVRFAFVFLKNEPAVHKIDLETFHRVKTISLKNYSCIPASMAYTHLSGFYFIQCQSKSLLGAPAQLLVDSVTDTVIGPNHNITGQAYVSPDGRYVVTPDPRRSKLTVQTVSFQGELTLNQELDESISVSDMVFQPSFTESNQHMLVAASGSGSDLLFADLSSGRTEVLRSLKEPLAAQAWPWGGANRVIVSSGLFGQYLVTPSVESLFILDGKQRTPHCEVSDIKRANTVVWVGEV
uniref:Follistatin like 4 n=1 Tax=Xiphophorus couchianus TaxID=32473 RepID=A0A3B5LBH4_9TELE